MGLRHFVTWASRPRLIGCHASTLFGEACFRAGRSRGACGHTDAGSAHGRWTPRPWHPAVASPSALRPLTSGLLFQPGQILVVVLLGILLLAGMIFYVVNVGDQLNGHLAMQNAADATAVGGATWMARSMNTVAMNNVAQTRMLALVPILDSLPLATELANLDATAWLNRLNDQLAVVEGAAQLKTINNQDSPLYQGLKLLRDRFERQKNILDPMDRLFNQGIFRMERLTYWHLADQPGPPPHGELWRAAVSLDELSQSVTSSAGVLSQSNAVQYGHGDGASDAFVTPILPEFPGRRGAFIDFAGPVKHGIIPDRQWPYRLGPFDRLFRWRDYRGHTVPGRYVPPAPGSGQIQPGSSGFSLGGQTRATGSGALSGMGNPNGYWTWRPIDQTGYAPYGPFDWMMDQVGWWAQSTSGLSDTLFARPWSGTSAGPAGYATQRPIDQTNYYMGTLAPAKLAYMWGDKAQRQIHRPHWVINYPQALALADRGGVTIRQTMFYRIEVRSRYPRTDGRFLSPGSFFIPPTPMAVWVDHWENPAKWSLQQIGEWIWEDQWFYQTEQDATIGIALQLDASGKPVLFNVYVVSDYVFGGIDVGSDEPIHDPSNYDSLDDASLPAPILMADNAKDYTSDHDQGSRRSQFTWLGVARKPNTPTAWAQRFGSGNPFDHILAVSQVEIFNATSWDLWTQDWKVKLVPVTRWDDWISRLSQGVDQADQTEGIVSMSAVSETYRYLSNFSAEMAQQMMQH